MTQTGKPDAKSLRGPSSHGNKVDSNLATKEFPIASDDTDATLQGGCSDVKGWRTMWVLDDGLQDIHIYMQVTSAGS